MLEFEIAILKRVSHEYIISLKEVFETPKVRSVDWDLFIFLINQSHDTHADRKATWYWNTVAEELCKITYVILKRPPGPVLFSQI